MDLKTLYKKTGIATSTQLHQTPRCKHYNHQDNLYALHRMYFHAQIADSLTTKHSSLGCHCFLSVGPMVFHLPCTMYYLLSHILPISHPGTAVCRWLGTKWSATQSIELWLCVSRDHLCNRHRTILQVTELISPNEDSFTLHKITHISGAKYTGSTCKRCFSVPKEAACQTLPNSISFMHGQARLKVFSADILPLGNHSR